jgi:hypothetical protein
MRAMVVRSHPLMHSLSRERETLAAVEMTGAAAEEIQADMEAKGAHTKECILCTFPFCAR